MSQYRQSIRSRSRDQWVIIAGRVRGSDRGNDRGPLCSLLHRQSDFKSAAFWTCLGEPKIAAVTLDDLPGNGKSQTHSGSLGGKKRIEYLGFIVESDARSGILDLKRDDRFSVVGRYRIALMVVGPIAIASIAFLTKFKITCWSWIGSALSCGTSSWNSVETDTP
jgi:hypothetical protein